MIVFYCYYNFGATKNKITDLPEEVRAAYPGTANSIVGIHNCFGYKTDGLFQSQAEIDMLLK
jgi:hypothetical protein